MLEGLEISIVELKQAELFQDFRIDSETFSKLYLETERLLRERETKKIGDFAVSVQNFGAYSLCNQIKFLESGIPFLMTQNVQKNYIEWDNVSHVSGNIHKILYKSHCKHNQVLLTMSGAYLGRAAVFNRSIECSSNQAVAKITLPKIGISPYYISTFFNSKFGQNQINQLKTVTGQPNINMSLIKELEIVFLSHSFQTQIESLVKQAHTKQEESKRLYQVAENSLLAELGIDESVMKTTDNEVVSNIKSFAEFEDSWRLDAEYYQPKYEVLEDLLNKFVQISIIELVNYPVVSGTTPKAGDSTFYTDSENGIPFLRAVDIKENKVTIEDANYIKREVHNGILKRTKLLKGDVLFSIAGTVGRCGIFENECEANINQACAILRFDENIVQRLYVILFFNSDIGQLIIEKYARQGVQTNLNLEELAKLKIPILPMYIQKIITQKIQASFQLKTESEHLLSLAKRGVELAIENGEDAAMVLINTESL